MSFFIRNMYYYFQGDEYGYYNEAGEWVEYDEAEYYGEEWGEEGKEGTDLKPDKAETPAPLDQDETSKAGLSILYSVSLCLYFYICLYVSLPLLFSLWLIS